MEKNKTIYTNYKANGELRDMNKPIGSIAILVAVISLYDKNIANEIFSQEVASNFGRRGYWEEKTEYYGKSLLWFGEHMYATKNFLK